MNTEGMKSCFGCKKSKVLSDFNRDVTRKDGRKSRCAVCTRIAANVWNAENPHKARKRALAWQRRNPSRCLFISTKCRAKRLGIAFNISESDIQIPLRCPVLDLVLSRGQEGPHDGSPTVDRIIPSKGYVKGNVIVICALANRVKSNQTDPGVLRKVVEYMGRVC